MIVEAGEPAETMVEFAKMEGVDLIVIGSSNKGFIESRLKGSVSRRVAETAHCSVYLVRA